MWKSKENSRINELNYEKIIGLLVDEGLIEEAVSALGEMKNHRVSPTLEIYYLVIHGFTRKGRFKDALFYLKEMEEIDLKPESDIFDSFIKAYGKYKMYDEMGQCVKQMESSGCLPDHGTYNLLIREFSRAGLLKQMERTYQIIISKRMDLQSSTLISMLEAYANFGIMDKMEKFLKKVLNSRTPLDDDLIRKIAGIYIDNYMFSRVEDLGIDLSSKIGRTDLVWCLRMLSHACILSRKGMDSIVYEMEADGLPWNVTVANILLLTYLKMRDFKHLNIVLSELPARYVKPDIVTVGILFDAYRYGFDGTYILNIWRRMGFLDESIEMNTDALVLTSYGKGHFLKSFEEVYSSLEPNSVKGKVWTYHHLINLVRKHNKQLIN